MMRTKEEKSSMADLDIGSVVAGPSPDSDCYPSPSMLSAKIIMTSSMDSMDLHQNISCKEEEMMEISPATMTSTEDESSSDSDIEVDDKDSDSDSDSSSDSDWESVDNDEDDCIVFQDAEENDADDCIVFRESDEDYDDCVVFQDNDEDMSNACGSSTKNDCLSYRNGKNAEDIYDGPNYTGINGYAAPKGSPQIVNGFVNGHNHDSNPAFRSQKNSQTSICWASSLTQKCKNQLLCPAKNKKVHFNDNHLVQIIEFEDDEDSKAVRKAFWEVFAVDRGRFKDRILKTAESLGSIFTPEHREKIYRERIVNSADAIQHDTQPSMIMDSKLFSDIENPENAPNCDQNSQPQIQHRRSRGRNRKKNKSKSKAIE